MALSIEKKKLIEEFFAGAKNQEVQELSSQIRVLKEAIKIDQYKKDPINACIDTQARCASQDIRLITDNGRGINTTAKRMEAEGKKAAESIIEKFSQNYYGDKLLGAADNLQNSTQDLINPINPFDSRTTEYDQLEARKSPDFLDIEAAARTERDYQYAKDRAGTTTPDPNNKSILDWDDNYLKNFGSDKAVANLLKTCIPCEFRVKFTGEFSLPWVNVMADLRAKWELLFKDLLNLKGMPNEFSKDLCNLFKFLDGQCIPDITGLLSLLSLMQLKYMELGTFSLKNILNQLLAPFLSPVVAGLTSNLDKYVNLIVGPLKCIVTALEKQIVDLQKQINGAVNIVDINRSKFYKTEIDFIEKRIKSLRNRRKDLLIQDTPSSPTAFKAAGQQEALNLNSTVDLPDFVPERLKNYDTSREQRVIQTKLVRGGINLDPADGESAKTTVAIGKAIGSYDENATKAQITIKNEITNIDKELKKLQLKRQESQTNLQNAYPKTSKGVDFSKATNLTTASKFALNNIERSAVSIITTLTDAVNDGIGIVKQSLDIYRDELMRLVLGRVNTQQDQVEFTRNLQKIAQLVSIVKTVDQLQKKGLFNLKKLCEQGGSSGALSEIAKQLKSNNSLGAMDQNFYKGTDSDGNEIILIAPSNAKVSSTGIEFDFTENQDPLFGDSVPTLESVTKTATFNDLNEVDRLNREGIIPDIGNIDSKIIELDVGAAPGSALDLHFKTSYAIISNEFCSKSAIDLGSSDTVKKWAEKLWQKD